MDRKKMCKDCGVEKPINNFTKVINKNGTGTTYYRPYCKPCMVIKTRKYNAKNPELIKKYQREYQARRRLSIKQGK